MLPNLATSNVIPNSATNNTSSNPSIAAKMLGSSSPARSAITKRKMPSSFYKPPVMKTQLFSSCILESTTTQNARVHHSHTNSLPVEAPLSVMSNYPLNNGSMNNIYEQTTPSKFDYNPPQHIQPITNPYISNFNPILANKLEHAPMMPQHSKTFSLPVAFDPNQHLAPPVRGVNSGDVPLPPGWGMERAPSGQCYFINHITQTTTWDDPRKLYNLPNNQNEISNDLRRTINNTIPLPTGWEEARTPTGEIYFINHNTQTTCWEDPRLSIYMQQEQNKFNSNYNICNNANNTNYARLGGGGFSVNNHMPERSLSTSSSSTSLSSSSCSSLNSLNNTNSYNTTNTSYDSYSQIYPSDSVRLTTKMSNENLIISLKKSLDELLDQKKMICTQLEELSKKEMSLKSMLTPQHLDDVLKSLKTNNTNMNSFSQYARSDKQPIAPSTNPAPAQPLNPGPVLPAPKSSNLNTSLLNSSNTEVGVDMDSTLVVAETSSTNLNTSANA